MGTPSLAALFFCKAGSCEDSLKKTLNEESVLSIFGLQWKGVWLSWTLILGFYKAVTEWSIQQLGPPKQNRSDLVGECEWRLSQMLLNPCVTLHIPL